MKHLSLLTLLFPLALAADRPEYGSVNMTIAFFSDTDSSSCTNADTSKGLVLTTFTVPYSFTCFNVSDIFSQTNTTGSTNGSRGFSNPEQLDPPNRVDWLLKNLDNYDSNANYSHVWYEQNNGVGKVEEGVDARWVFYVYPFESCKQLGDEPFNENKNPWFETSCQTKSGGQCRTVPNPIKSFALNKAEDYNKIHGSCETWAYMGAAARFEKLFIGTVVVAACATAFLLL